MKLYLLSTSLVLISCLLLTSFAEEDPSKDNDDFFSNLFNSLFGGSDDENQSQSQNTTESSQPQNETLAATSTQGNATEQQRSTVGSDVASAPASSETNVATGTPNTPAQDSQGKRTGTTGTYDMFTGHTQKIERTQTTPSEKKSEDSSIGSFFKKLFSGAEENSDTDTHGTGSPAIITYTDNAVPTRPPIVCKSNPDLLDYCIIPESLSKYLQNNSTFDNLESKVYNCDVIRQLKKECRRGDWCLPKEIVFNFMQLSDVFIGGPLCSSGLASCLHIVNSDQANCPISKSVYQVDAAIELLCEIGKQSGLTYECFGHVMAMLHVNLADMLRGDSVPDDGNTTTLCETQRGLQIKEYLCLKDLCTQELSILMRFEPWWWFNSDMDKYTHTCAYSDVCGHEQRTRTSTVIPVTTFKPETTLQAEVNQAANIDSDDGQPTLSSQDDPRQKIKEYYNKMGSNGKTRMLIGVSAAVLIATFGLTMLVCALWKRINRHHHKRYHPGYSKLTSEEVQPLYQ